MCEEPQGAPRRNEYYHTAHIGSTPQVGPADLEQEVRPYSKCSNEPCKPAAAHILWLLLTLVVLAVPLTGYPLMTFLRAVKLCAPAP
jgi:hypothetical protein